MVVVDSIAATSYKTKAMVEMLKALGAEKKALIVLPAADQLVVKSCANIPGVKTTVHNAISVYDVLNCDTLIVAKGAVEKIEEVYAK
jgi:large subunit ribosomal protein L4